MKNPQTGAVNRRLLLSFVFVTLAVSARAQVDIGTIYARQGFTAFPIAVTEFDQTGATSLGQPGIHEVVLNDLMLSGFFRAPDNPQFVRETHLQDKAQNTINFAEWWRLRIPYLVKGSYEIINGELQVTVKAFDVVSQQRIFGRLYRDYKPDEIRQVAHQISNDIMQFILDVPGISHTQIAFVRSVSRTGHNKQVCIMDADGSNVVALTQDNELTATPAWGLKGGEIYYTTYRDFNPDLAGMILGSRETWWISRRAGFNLSPAWTPVAQRIALTLTKDGNSEIYTMDRAGKDLRRLTINQSIDSSPVWSPDGTQIAFTSDRSGMPQIYILDVNTQQVKRFTYEGNYNDGAAWSPDGARIAWCSRIDGQFQIMSMNLDGTDLRKLTNGPGNNEDPTWAPNGWRIAFSSDRSGTKQIYSMFPDGSNVQQLTQAPLNCQSPAWSPLWEAQGGQ